MIGVPSPVDWSEGPGLFLLVVPLAIGAAVALLVWWLPGKATG